MLRVVAVVIYFLIVTPYEKVRERFGKPEAESSDPNPVVPVQGDRGSCSPHVEAAQCDPAAQLELSAFNNAHAGKGGRWSSTGSEARAKDHGRK